MPPTEKQSNATYQTTKQCHLSYYTTMQPITLQQIATCHYNRLPLITTIQHNTAYETTVYYCLSDYSTMPLIRLKHNHVPRNRGADKSLARPGRKQTTAKEDLDFNISYL
jgi:hypothetical protein